MLSSYRLDAFAAQQLYYVDSLYTQCVRTKA